MDEAANSDKAIDTESAISRILATIEREREREIISRRFGLSDRKETLEQIGDLLGITRERVRQLEKAILIRLKLAAEEGIEDVTVAEKQILKCLHELGGAARLSQLTESLLDSNDERKQAHIAFVAELAPNLTVLNENDNYYHGIAIKDRYDEKQLKSCVDEVVTTIKANKEPISLQDLHDKLNYDHPDQVKALATLSKLLANLKDQWGLTKWPTVNPKNIRDKIYVILQESGKPLHFSDIAKAIKQSDFKRKNVTTQAIHNELIKDKRFVLIGRGIYALNEWGFKQGTVSDIIADVLKKEAGPLMRDEIVKRVLKHRQVKETTILLNLQSKPEFKRVAKATYDLTERLEATTVEQPAVDSAATAEAT